MSLSNIDSSVVDSMGSFEDWQWLSINSGASPESSPAAQPLTQWPASEAECLTQVVSSASDPAHEQVQAITSTEPVNLPIHHNVHPSFQGYQQPPHPHQGHWPHPYPTLQVGGSVYRVPPQGWYPQHPVYPKSIQLMAGGGNMHPQVRPWTGPALPRQGQLCQVLQAPSNKQVSHQASIPVGGNGNVVKATLNGVKKLKRKRKRTAFTTDQILALEKVFATQPYIERKDRQTLGQKLDIDDRALKVWFQNRRMKGKRLKAELDEELEEAMNSESPDSDYNSSESIISSSNELDYVESQIRKSDENGLVTLDNRALETLFNVIGAHVPPSAEFTLTISDEPPTIKENVRESPKSTVPALGLPTTKQNVALKYEPISPVESLPMEQNDATDNKECLFEYQGIVLKASSDEDKKNLFKLHFC